MVRRIPRGQIFPEQSPVFLGDAYLHNRHSLFDYDGEYKSIGRNRVEDCVNEHLVRAGVGRQRSPHKGSVDQPAERGGANERVSLNGLTSQFTGERRDQNFAAANSIPQGISC
jgi:hypothetical protein